MKSIQKMILPIFLVYFCMTIMPCCLFSEVHEKNNEFLVLNNPSDSGMFAVFHSVLGVLQLYEQGNFAGVHIDLNSGRYLDPKKGDNWWEYFFNPIKLGDENAPKHVISLEEYMYLATAGMLQSREEAHYFIQKYVELKPNIQKEIDAYCERYFNKNYVIGVHHRGTDKVTEWALVPYEKTYNVLKEVIKTLTKQQKKNLKIYVATDEQNFINYLLARLPSKIIFSNHVRSNTSTPLHDYNTGFYSSNYQMGKEALFDCLLLSRCQLLIRPQSSCLSRVSTCFNPSIPIINLVE